MQTQLLFTSPNPPIPLPETTLHDLILGGARDRADVVALVDAMSGQSLTFGALADRVGRVVPRRLLASRQGDPAVREDRAQRDPGRRADRRSRRPEAA